MKPKQDHALLDAIITEFALHNDAALSSFLGVAPSMVSKLRSRSLSVTGDTVLRVYDRTGWSIETIRKLLKLA
jgi:plasmid maintenance system antidote protein VapI